MMSKGNKRVRQSIRPSEELYTRAMVEQITARDGAKDQGADSHGDQRIGASGKASNTGWQPVRRLHSTSHKDSSVKASESDSESLSESDDEANLSKETSGPHGHDSSFGGISGKTSGMGGSSRKHSVLKRDKRGSISVTKTFDALGKKALQSILPSRAKVRFHKVEKEKIPLFVPTLFLYEEDEDLFSDGAHPEKHYYTLNIIQRIFVAMDHPNSCQVATSINAFVTLVTVLSVSIYLITSQPEVKEAPATCDRPTCDNHPTLCPGEIVCEPEPPVVYDTIETVCLYVFVIDYFTRLLLCPAVPPRLAGVDPATINHNIFPKPGAGRGGASKIEGSADSAHSSSSSSSQAGHRFKPSLAIETSSGTGAIDQSVSSSAMSSPNRWEAENFIATPSATSVQGGTTPEAGNNNNNKPNGVPDAIRESDSGDEDGGLSSEAVRLAADYDAAVSAEENTSAGHTHTHRHKTITTRSGSIKAKHFIEMKKPRMSFITNPEEQLYIDKALERTLAEKAYSLFECIPEGHSVLSLLSVSLQQGARYVCQWMNMVDLVAIIPFFLSASGGGGGGGSTLSVVRVLRLARIFRVLKLGKNSKGLQVLMATMARSLSALVLLIFFSAIGFILLGSMEFFFEGGDFKVTEDYPNGAYMIPDLTGTSQERSRFMSIPMSMYWSIMTSTGVGFGDIVPHTPGGRFCAICAMYGGIFVLALPISVIGNNFQLIYDQSKGHLSYGVVNAILELMEDDSEHEPTLESLQHDAEIVGDDGVSDIGVFKSRRELLEKRASKLASVFVIAQVCLKESESDDINFLLIKVGLRDMIAALEYVYDLDFRQQQLEDFVLQTVSEKLHKRMEVADTDEDDDAYDDGDGDGDGLGDASPWRKRGSIITEGDGTWSPSSAGDSEGEDERGTGASKPVAAGAAGVAAEDEITSDVPFLSQVLTNADKMISHIPSVKEEIFAHNKDNFASAFDSTADLEKGTFKFHTRNSEDFLGRPSAMAPTASSPHSRGRRRSSVTDMRVEHKDGSQTIGKRLPIGEYRFAPGETDVDFESVEIDEHEFYEKEFDRLTKRTQELLHYLRKSPEYMEHGYLRKIYQAALKAGLEGGSIRSLDFHSLHEQALASVRRYKAGSDIKSKINMAKRRVTVAYQRVEMAMHELELDHHIPPNSPMRNKLSNRTPFSNIAGAELSPMTAASSETTGGAGGEEGMGGSKSSIGSPGAKSGMAGDGPDADSEAFTPFSANTNRTTKTINTTASGYTHVPTGETPLPDDAGSPSKQSRAPIMTGGVRETHFASTIEAEVDSSDSQGD